MKKILKNFLSSIVLLLKLITFGSIIFTFFALFSSYPRMQHLMGPSRTTAVTLMIFGIVGLLMLKTYGTYDIGQRKSKPIIYSLSVGILFTDAVTFLALSVMNTNVDFNPTFRLTGWWMLIPIFVIQVIILTIMVYFGNFIYFAICDPKKIIIVVDDSLNRDIKHTIRAINASKKQYKVDKVIDYHNISAAIIAQYDIVYIDEIPVEERRIITELCYQSLKHIMFRPLIVSDIVEVSAEQIIIDDMLTISANVKYLSLEQRFMKRCIDIAISLVGILITLPIWIIFALLIYREDKGSIFYKQKRLTRDGKEFNVLKFRTMKENSDNYRALDGDDRITKIGRILRKIRLDELPQLLNILYGDMSIVGPRPEMIESYDVYKQEFPIFYYRLRVKGGLTGYAQIAGKYNTSREDKLALDLMYIENYSIWLDIKLIFQTITVFFKKDSTEGFKDEQV